MGRPITLLSAGKVEQEAVSEWDLTTQPLAVVRGISEPRLPFLSSRLPSPNAKVRRRIEVKVCIKIVF